MVPGVRFEFERTGPGTPHAEFTFDLISKSEIVAVPAIHHFGDETETRRREVQASLDWLGVSIMRGLGCVFNLLWAVAQPARVGTRSDIVFSVEDIISQRLSEKINIGDIANELAISHVHLLRLFREEHGTTIQEYLRRMRLEQARHLIIATDMPLKEIASRTGMPDLQYFNKIVRDETGLSPRGLRAQPANREIH